MDKVKPLELAGQKNSSKEGSLFNTDIVESIAQAKQLSDIDFSVRRIVSI